MVDHAWIDVCCVGVGETWVIVCSSQLLVVFLVVVVNSSMVASMLMG